VTRRRRGRILAALLAPVTAGTREPPVTLWIPDNGRDGPHPPVEQQLAEGRRVIIYTAEESPRDDCPGANAGAVGPAGG
jgi:hypothetical protein